MKHGVRMTILGFSLMAAACAAPTQRRTAGPRGSEIGRVDGLGETQAATPEGGMLSDVVAAPPEEVFQAAITVYEEMGIEMPRVDGVGLVLQNPRFIVSRRLLDRRLSSFLNCGAGMQGANADSFRINMHIVTTVEAEGEGSRLGTQIEATATNPRGTSNATMECSSTFSLETRILESVRGRVGGSGTP